MSWRLQYAIYNPGLLASGWERIINEGGAGFINGHYVGETHIDDGFETHVAALAASGGLLDAPIDDSKVPALIAGLQAYAPGEAFVSNYYEFLVYGVNRDFHITQLLKILSAVHAAGIETGHYGFPTWSQTDAEDDYAMERIGPYLDRIDIECYLNTPSGGFGQDLDRVDERFRKAWRVAGGRPVYAWIYPIAGGQLVDTAKLDALIAYIATKNPDGIVVWTDDPDPASSNAALAIIRPYAGVSVIRQTTFQWDYGPGLVQDNTYYTFRSLNGTVRVARSKANTVLLNSQQSVVIQLNIDTSWLPGYLTWDDGGSGNTPTNKQDIVMDGTSAGSTTVFDDTEATLG